MRCFSQRLEFSFAVMRRAAQCAMLAWALGTGVVWGQNSEPWWSQTGGEVSGIQRIGLPWNALSARVWGLRRQSPFEEWAFGWTHQGWTAWTQSELTAGARFQTSEHARFEGMVSAGLVRWPEVHGHSGLFRADVAGMHDRPWGIFRLHAFAEAGQGQTWWRENPNAHLDLGGNRWGWEMLWSPQLDGVTWPLPALSWASDGSWTLSWSASHEAWTGQRLWRRPPGGIQLAWTYPESRVDVAWRCSLISNGNRVGRASTRAPEQEGQPRSHFMRLGTSAHRLQTSWQWAWEWLPTEKPLRL